MDLQFAKSGVFISGRWRASSTGDLIDIEDPSCGERIGALSSGSSDDVDEAVAAARAALGGVWGGLAAAERGRILTRIGQAILEHTEALAELEAHDVGKPLRQARADVIALARYLEFYGGAADKLHGQTIPYQPGYTVYTLREPYGVTGHIIPWNYPMQIIGRSVVAALAVGNAAVLKPAEQASMTALTFARIAHEAGLPAGALNVVPGLGSIAGAALSAHPGIDHISFTGSTGVGQMIQASAARNAVPVTLELGGKSPQIVFDDADIEKALPFLVNAGIQNAGQTCSAGSRVLVQRGIYDQLVSRLAERFAALQSGPAMSDLDMGPLITARQKAMVEAFMTQGRAELTLVAQGRIAADAPAGGHYAPAALFADVAPDHRLAQEEIFGPVQVVVPFSDEADAVRIANGTPYGLVAAAWTRDADRLLRMPHALRAGQVFLNNYGAAGGVELPFGGVGRSGHGREKGFEALYSFTTLKTVAAHHG